jgi:hypothetical protein
MSASRDLVPKFAEGLVPTRSQTSYLRTGGAGPLPLHGDTQVRGPQAHLPDVRAVGERRLGRQPAGPPAGLVHELGGRSGTARAGP